jgi:hypothetical protein
MVFSNIPDWQSFENQGANIASADIDGDGLPELFVLRVDSPGGGPNRAFYRVGHGLAVRDSSRVTWDPWVEVPAWGSNQNHGAGIAIADFGADGLALVVFQIQHVDPGPNAGLFSIGRKLSATGAVTGGWTAWQAVPGWTSWRNQGAAIAIADVDGDGAADLVVFAIDDFHTDNPLRPNRAFYRLGSKLTVNGAISAWGPWLEVDWFSWFNQGAGLALDDLDGDGRPEIVIFQIDNPPGVNAGYLRVGWTLDTQARVQQGWGPWQKIDDWNSWEDQGGGLALSSFGAGRPQLVVFHVDNPAGLNAGLFSVSDFELDIDEAASLGIWRLLPYFSEVLPVHAALLHSGKVLFFAGSGNNAFRADSGDLGNDAKAIYTSVVWDPSKNVLDAGTFDHPPTLRRADGSVIDLFCCGHTFLADGRVLAAGGTLVYDKVIVGGVQQDSGHGFFGAREAMIFDPALETWTLIASMNRGRWYPTLMRLDDGTILATAGLDQNGAGPGANTIESNTDPDTAPWVVARDFDLPLYPHLFQLADGRVFHTGGQMDTDENSVSLVFDPRLPTNAVVIAVPDAGRCNQSASVIMPSVQEQRFMLLGGGPEDDGPVRGDATNRVSIIDFTVPAPVYRQAAPLNINRMHVNAVLLPDRTILAAGGAFTREASTTSGTINPQLGREVFQAEIYDPAKGTWTETAPATVARLYHSIALLLPDGRVLAASGNPDKGSQVPWLPPDPMEEERIEIFSPPYLFRSKTRPAITSAPGVIGYGGTFTIKCPQAASILWAQLIAPGLTTHSFNSTQRLVDLSFVVSAPGVLQATVTTNKKIAPPGWYMLFLTDTDKVPSVSVWTHLA